MRITQTKFHDFPMHGIFIGQIPGFPGEWEPCILSKMISIYYLTLNKWRPSWIFLPTMQCLKYFRQHHNVRYTWKPHDGHQKHESASIMSKMISIYCLTLDKWRPYWIFYPQFNIQNIFRRHHNVRHTWKPHDRHKKTRICLYYVENEINLLFDFERMAAILDFSPTMQYLKYFPTTPQCPAYLKTPW